jgi:hypothetical protein
MTYACFAWQFAADNPFFLKLQRLQNEVFHTLGSFSSRTPIRNLHVAFKIPYVYDFNIKLCRQQAEVIQVTSEVLMAAIMKTDVFWFLAPCGLVDVCRRFRGACCHRPPDSGSSKQL